LSTILKALRRLEKEKAPKDRPLREQVATSGDDGRGDEPAPRRWPILVGAIGAGVFTGLAVLFLLLYRGAPSEEVPGAMPAQPAETAAAPPAPAAPARKGILRPIPRAQPPAAARPPAPAEVEVAEEVEVIDRGTVPPRIALESGTPPEADAAAPRPGSVRPFQRSDPKALPGRHLLPEEQPVAVEAPEAEATAPPAPEIARPAPAPEMARPEPAPEIARRAPAPEIERRTPAPEVANRAPAQPEPEVAKPAARPPAPPAPAFPALRVEGTTWHPTAERRVALVAVGDEGAQSVREGEQVGGAVVRRIEPSGVVFEHAGREVRRKVGE
jgi:hypothetical protein